MFYFEAYYYSFYIIKMWVILFFYLITENFKPISNGVEPYNPWPDYAFTGKTTFI